MALLHEMSEEEITARFKNDSSFGIPNDEVAATVFLADSVSHESFRKKMIQYHQDKAKHGPWLPENEPLRGVP